MNALRQSPKRAKNRLATAVLGVALGSAWLLTPFVAHAVTLRDELLVLLDSHPSIKAQEDNVSAAGEAIGRADASFLPVVNFTGDNGYKEINGPSQRAASNRWGRGFKQYGLNVTQNIYDGWRKYNDKTSAELGRESAQSTLSETRHNLLLQGANAYVDVLRQMRLVRLARKSEATIALQLSLEDERVQKGGGTSVDVLLSKTRLQRSKEQRIIFEGRMRDAVTRYTIIFGKSPVLEELEDSALRMDLVPDSVDTAIATALSGNPIILSSNKQIDIARMRQRSATADYYPRLDMVGAANWEDNREGTVGFRRDWSVTLQASWNLFSGFSTRANVAEAAHSYSASINNHLFANRRIEEETRLAWQGLLTACNRRILLDNASIIAGEVHASRVILRDNGKETVINVLDAESEVFNAEINHAQASYDEKLASYRLIIAMGQSLADALVEVEDSAARSEAETRYAKRCEDQLQTVALRTAPKSEARDSANPFAAPAADADEDGTAKDPFAAPDEGDSEGDTSATNPFSKPGEDDEVKKIDIDESDDVPEDETGAANPFDSPSTAPSTDEQSSAPSRPKTDLISSDENIGDGEAEIESVIRLRAQEIPAAIALVLNQIDDELQPSKPLARIEDEEQADQGIDWDDDQSVKRTTVE